MSVFGHVGCKLALAVVVDDGLWQIFKFNGRRPQQRLLNLKFCQRPTLWMTAIALIKLPKVVVHNNDH